VYIFLHTVLFVSISQVDLIGNMKVVCEMI